MESINTSTYILDFTIPQGPTGPTGLNNSIDAGIFANYDNKNTSGVLSIKDSFFPTNISNIFRAYSDYININQAGCYEFTISGYLFESQNFNNASLILRTNIQNQTRRNDLITVRLNSNKNESYFSYTKIGKYSTLQKVSLIFNKEENSDAYVSQITLIIKKRQ